MGVGIGESNACGAREYYLAESQVCLSVILLIEKIPSSLNSYGVAR